METPEVDWNMVILHMPMLEGLPGEVKWRDGGRWRDEQTGRSVEQNMTIFAVAESINTGPVWIILCLRFYTFTFIVWF